MMPPAGPRAGKRVFCSKRCPNTIWRPGLLVGTSPAGGSDLPGDDSCVMLIQRAPGDDGWLAISESGIVFNVFDSIARLYHTVRILISSDEDEAWQEQMDRADRQREYAPVFRIQVPALQGEP
jgi:hypothetical protein